MYYCAILLFTLWRTFIWILVASRLYLSQNWSWCRNLRHMPLSFEMHNQLKSDDEPVMLDYPMLCPPSNVEAIMFMLCRTKIDPSSFEPKDLAIISSSCSVLNQQPSPKGLGLTEQELASLRQMQIRHRALYAQQEARVRFHVPLKTFTRP